MKVVLTGVAGFLGSHIADALILSGNSVIGVDDLSTGSIMNIQHLVNHPNFTFHDHDVRNPYYFECDAILNFACPASPVQYQADPVKTIETNFLGMKNALTLAVQENAIVLQASTSEIYGDPSISPQAEDYWGNVNPIGIRSCYDEGKRAAETLCFDYMRQREVDVRVIRIFNTYGPRMAIDDGRVVSNFIVQALNGDPLTIYGDGTQTRSFCYVSDLVDGIYKTLVSGEAFDTPVNLGNPVENSMNDLAELVIRITNSNSRIIKQELPMDDPRQRKPDISLAVKKINWEPSVKLELGIEKTAKYFAEALLK